MASDYDREQLSELMRDLFEPDTAQLTPLRLFALETMVASMLSHYPRDVIDQTAFPGHEVEVEAILGQPAAVAFDNVFRRVRFLMSFLHGIHFPDEE